MSVIECIKGCRSVRKYTGKQVSRADVEKIVDAGLHAPNAGGGQRSMVVAIRDAGLAERVGRMNMASFSRANLIGGPLSAEQPSVIDDPTIKNGFYGAPCVACVFCQQNFAFSAPDGFIVAQVMALAAHSLGVSSCIVSRAEKTFVSPEGRRLLAEWGVPEGYACRAHLAMGYCDDPYPTAKPRRPGRAKIIEEQP